MTGPVDQGQTYRYRQTVKDSSGILANAGTVTFTVTLPDLTTATPAVVNAGTGLYDIAYTATQAGLHQLRGSATGGVLGSEFDFWNDAFTAEEPARLLIGVDEASSYLRAQGVITEDVDREQLRWVCSFATDAVERDLGLAIVKRSVTETFDGGDYELNLSTRPPRATNGGSVTISSVSENGSAVTAYVLRKRSWRLMRGTSASPIRWADGYENISVVYVPGCTVPPQVARMGALTVAQSVWQQSQQASHPLLDESLAEAFAAPALPTLSRIPGYGSLRSVGVA